jgi:hypothetical protein
MNDFEKIELAFDILESADVIEEFSDSIWVKVDIDLWNKFINEGSK